METLVKKMRKDGERTGQEELKTACEGSCESKHGHQGREASRGRFWMQVPDKTFPTPPSSVISFSSPLSPPLLPTASVIKPPGKHYSSVLTDYRNYTSILPMGRLTERLEELARCH